MEVDVDFYKTKKVFYRTKKVFPNTIQLRAPAFLALSLAVIIGAGALLQTTMNKDTCQSFAEVLDPSERTTCPPNAYIELTPVAEGVLVMCSCPSWADLPAVEPESGE
jgi:hypothetical protein